MARIKTKELKDQFLFRVYDTQENELLHRAISKFKDKFDSLSDIIKYFALVGADKLLGDNNINNSINFSEIRRLFQSIDDKLEKIVGEQKMNFVETNAEIKTNQSLINLTTKMLKRIKDFDVYAFTDKWKYTPLSQSDVDTLKDDYKDELLDVKRNNT